MDDPKAPAIPTIRGPVADRMVLIARLVVGLVAAFTFGVLGMAVGAQFSVGLSFLMGMTSFAGGFWVTQVVISAILKDSSLGSGDHVGHWSQMIEGLQESPSAFYQHVADALGGKNIPDLAVSHLFAREGGALSAKRLYLAAEREQLTFLVCGAPFGNGFFVSWWLVEPRDLWAELASLFPFGESLFPFLFRPRTYYEIDTMLLFKSLTHSAVMEVVDGLIAQKGLRGLTELERKPVLRDFFKAN